MDRVGYEEAQKVSYFQIDGKREMSPAALLASLQEVAVAHADSLGYTLEYLAERQWGWSVVNWHLKVFRLPRHGETIQIQTWCDKCLRFQAERSFYILDAEGNRLLEGASRWIFMDFNRRRPTNIPKDMVESYCERQEPAIADEKFFMPKEAEGELLSVREFTVTRRDTDTNGHANNVKYLEWVMDDVPDEIYDGMTLKDVRMVYRKECMRGDTVQVKTYVKDTENGKEVQTFLFEGDKVMAEAATLWQ